MRPTAIIAAPVAGSSPREQIGSISAKPERGELCHEEKMVLALCLAAALAACETPLRSASAREYQCGRHFVETSGAIQVFGAIFYNRTRDNYKEGNPKSEEYVVDAWKSAVDAGHTHIGRILYRKKGVMYYRGEACVEYKEPAE